MRFRNIVNLIHQLLTLFSAFSFDLISLVSLVLLNNNQKVRLLNDDHFGKLMMISNQVYKLKVRTEGIK